MTTLSRSTLARALALAAFALPLSAQTTFQALGSSIPWLTVLDMSADGSALVATDGSQSYLWTTTNPTFTAFANVGLWDCDVANGGAYVSATLPDPNNGNLETAARWSAASGQWTFLPTLGGVSGTSASSAYDLSEDGSVVVGLGWISANRAHAFRWDAQNGTVDLGAFGGAQNSSRPNAVSADGTTAAGWDEDPITGVWRASRWSGLTENLLGCLDPSDPINGPSQAETVSGNGVYVAGKSASGLSTPSGWNEMHLFRWDPLNGLIDRGTCNIDPFGWGNHETIPSGISDDGRVIVGGAGTAGFFGGGLRPFISREGSPMTLLQDDLLALGVPEAATWIFGDVVGISRDGRVLAGNGYNAQFVAEPFRVVFPPLAESYCTAKVNSLGCTPAMFASGIASASSFLPFDVGASNVLNNKNGLLYFGFSPMSAPFQGGTKCVGIPTARTGLQDSGGTVLGNDCSGTYSFEFNALIQSGVMPQLAIGAKVYAQYWSRDPQATATTGLTNALSFTVFP
ncbi:MAG: hypothetical protein IT454_07110 [Planctomycetes bacterium]|nr:hypothetical protein [Planctomycetota bacterium]